MPAQTKDQEVLKLILSQLNYEEKGGVYEYNDKGDLIRLSISYAQTTPAKLPAEIGLLTSLQDLSLHNNQLTELPAEISQLKNLQVLNLAANQLTQLPTEIGHLTTLRALHLEGNHLIQIPRSIGQLINLEILSASRNQLTQLPDEIVHLTNLQCFDLSDNPLRSLSLSLCACHNLRFLYLEKSDLSELPAEIGRLTNLFSLWVDGNHLVHLPPEIGMLVHLRSLSLGSNRLTSLPPEIGQLTNLLDLYVYDNQLTQLPAQIEHLTQLEYLSMGKNPIAEFPREIKFLPNLWSLRLDDRQYSQFFSELEQVNRAIVNRKEEKTKEGLQPRRVYDNEVFILYKHFNLIDIAEPESFAPDFLHGNELWIQASSATITLISKSSDHYAQIRLEVWDHEPPFIADIWDERREVIFTSITGVIQLCMITEDPSERSDLLIGPPRLKYQVRAYRRCRPDLLRTISRYEAEIDLLNEESEEKEEDNEAEFPHDMERYLLQFWPG